MRAFNGTARVLVDPWYCWWKTQTGRQGLLDIIGLISPRDPPRPDFKKLPVGQWFDYKIDTVQETFGHLLRDGSNGRRMNPWKRRDAQGRCSFCGDPLCEHSKHVSGCSICNG